MKTDKLQSHLKLNYHLASRFPRGINRFSQDASRFSRDASGLSRDVFYEAFLVTRVCLKYITFRFSRDVSRFSLDVSRFSEARRVYSETFLVSRDTFLVSKKKRFSRF